LQQEGKGGHDRPAVGYALMKSKRKLSLGAAADHLAATDPDWEALIGAVGPCRLQLKAEGEPYQALVRAIAHQQLHGRAAETIFGRFLALYPGTSFPSPEDILATQESALRGCGFSASKVTTIHGIAAQTVAGVVPTRQIADTLSDDELIARLTTLRGIGRWTVEMLLISTLGRQDVLPVDDFGIREGWRVMKSLTTQPRPKALAEIGKAWSPYRSTAAWYLWRAADRAKAALRAATAQ
jgi:DNA-3-methyladenine glycosylase II